MPYRVPRPSSALLAAAMTLMAAVWARPSLAQREDYQRTGVYVNITDVRVQQLTNAVRLTLVADGTIDASPEWEAMSRHMRQSPSGNWEMAPLDEVPFVIWNGRSQVGNFVDVARYPVSHIELAPRGQGNLGIGLACKLVLYKPGGVTDAFGDFDWDPEYWQSVWGISILFDIRLAQDQRSIIITVLSDQYEDPAREVVRDPRPDALKRLAVGRVGPYYTIEAINVPLSRVCEELGRLTGRTFALKLQRERSVSMYLPAMSAENIVMALCGCYELSWAFGPNGEVILGEGRAADPMSYHALRSELVRCHNISAKDALNLLPRALLPYVRVDAGNNGIMVNGTDALISKVRADIETIDVKTPLIEVAAIVVHASGSAVRMLTSEWGGASWSSAWRVSPGRIEYGAEADAVTDPELAEATPVLIPRPTPPGGWIAALDALATDGRVRILARPMARVLNGHQASLFVGQERYRMIERRRFWQSPIRQVNLGVKLDVTPLVGDGDEITIRTEAEVSDIIGLVPASGNAVAAKRRISGTMRVTDGHSVVVGGLMTTTDDRTTASWPFVAEAPLLPDLFGLKHKTRGNEDIIFIVTARIVRDEPYALPDDSQSRALLQPGDSATNHPYGSRSGGDTSESTASAAPGPDAAMFVRSVRTRGGMGEH